MPVFAYNAIAGQRVERGTVVAESARGAREVLRERGLTVRDVRQEKEKKVRGISGAVGTELVRELATLIGVGMPVVEALELIGREAGAGGGPRAAVALRLAEKVRGGESLGRAFAAVGFDELAVSLVEVGESSGTLEAALVRLAEFRERSAGLKNRVLTALMYPAVVLTMAGVTSVVLMTVVVPKLLEALIESGRELPLPTRIVKTFSDAMVSYWWAGLLGIAAMIIGLRLLTRTPAWEHFVGRLPILGELIRKQAVVRVAVVMSALLKSGVEFVRALEIAASVTGSRVMREALARSAQRVTEGKEIGPSLASAGVFSPVVIQVFATGQQSGRLPEMLDRLAVDYDAQVAQGAARMVALLEPAVILVLVGMVGLIGFATVMPMLEAADAF